MVKISSRLTPFHKKAFPTIWFGFLGVFLLTAIVGGARADPMFLIVPIVMAAIGYVVMRMFIWDLVDEVYDRGDSLLVRNKGDEDTISLRDVMNVNSLTFTNPRRITLRLRHPGKFGTEVAFVPATTWTLNPFAKHPIAEDLIVRVDRARRGG